MARDEENREKQLLRCVPTILDYETLLYIGARKRRMQMVNLFVDASYTMDVLEIWPPNVASLKDLKYIRRVMEGDVRDVLKMNFTNYDVVMWWHGPEHVHWKELGKILKDLESLADKFTVVACPWGDNFQEIWKSNIHEEHVSSLYPEIFKGFDWEIDTIGERDTPGSNLLAWRKQ